MQVFLGFAPALWLDWNFSPPLLLVPLWVLTLIAAIWAASFFPRAEALLRKGMDLNRAGRPFEAELCYRRALVKRSSVSVRVRVRLLSNLGESLMDQGHYGEARECLNRALASGEPMGSCITSMARLLLLQGTEPQKALEMADKAMELPSYALDGAAFPLNLATAWALRAWALALLGRQREARQGIERAVDSMAAVLAGTPSHYKTKPLYVPDHHAIVRLGVSETQWTIGMALLAMQDTVEAGVHFRVASDTDPKGKYGKLALQRINS